MPKISIPNDIQEYAAPQLLGVLWNWCLYGALVVQFYVYSYNFPQDNKRLKLLVHSVFFLETVQTILSGVDLYYWFAAGFGKFKHLTSPFISSFDAPILGSVVSLCVQFFFVYRIRVLSEKRSWWLCLTICLLSIIGAVGAFCVGIASHHRKAFIEGIDLVVFEMTWLIGNTFSDALIATAMLYHLSRLLVKDGDFSNHIFVSVVRLTVETNLVTTTVSVISLFLVALYPWKNWYLCPTFLLGKLYSNTLLVSLNNRISIRDTYNVHGRVIDSSVVIIPGSGSALRATTDTIISEIESQSHPPGMTRHVGEAEVEESVKQNTQ